MAHHFSASVLSFMSIEFWNKRPMVRSMSFKYGSESYALCAANLASENCLGVQDVAQSIPRGCLQPIALTAALKSASDSVNSFVGALGSGERL